MFAELVISANLRLQRHGNLPQLKSPILTILAMRMHDQSIMAQIVQSKNGFHMRNLQGTN